MMKLGMGNCKLCFQAPVGKVTDPKQLIGKRIVTSFPNITRSYFDPKHETKIKYVSCLVKSRLIQNGFFFSLRYVTGSVEVAPSLGLADAVVDLVETGTTMRAAGLEAIGTLMETQTVLISNPHTTHGQLVEVITQRIQGYITASEHCMISYNCPRDKIKQAAAITPGHESPTVTPLEDEAMVSITALVKMKEVSDIMDRIKEMGGQSIVVMDVINCRF